MGVAQPIRQAPMMQQPANLLPEDLSSVWVDDAGSFSNDWYNNFMKEVINQPKDVLENALRQIDAFLSTKMPLGDKNTYMVQNFYRPLGLVYPY
jgi:hypothetical protein